MNGGILISQPISEGQNLSKVETQVLKRHSEQGKPIIVVLQCSAVTHKLENEFLDSVEKIKAATYTQSGAPIIFVNSNWLRYLDEDLLAPSNYVTSGYSIGNSSDDYGFNYVSGNETNEVCNPLYAQVATRKPLNSTHSSHKAIVEFREVALPMSFLEAEILKKNASLEVETPMLTSKAGCSFNPLLFRRKPRESFELLETSSDRPEHRITTNGGTTANDVTRKQIQRILEQISNSMKSLGARIPASQLAKWWAAYSSAQRAPLYRYETHTIKQILQTSTHPPTFTVWKSSAGRFPTQAENHLRSALRAELQAPGTPIAFTYKSMLTPNPYRELRSRDINRLVSVSVSGRLPRRSFLENKSLIRKKIIVERSQIL